jgi:flagellar hook-length control protein FliK
MLPDNILSTLKALTLPQKPLPTTTAEAAPKAVQFELGQKLQAIVQDQIAPNVFKVNVSGQLIQMQLPASIRSGDTVALQVIGIQPRLTFSMVNSANPLSTPEQLGSTARLLSAMSRQPPEKAYVQATQTAPLWEASAPPESKQLAGLLHEALGNSGLFYESHQAQWVGGARSTAQLLQEPQNQAPDQVKAALAGGAPSKPAATGEVASKLALTVDLGSKVVANANSNKPVVTDTIAGKTVTAGEPANNPAVAADTASKTAVASYNANAEVAASTTSNPSSTNAAPTQPNTAPLPDNKPQGIPDHLQPLVQQQLNALETRQVLWQGNVWPGQPMQWEIHEQPPKTHGSAEERQRQWVTQLHLDLPNLGEVAATLRFNSAGLSLVLNAATQEARAALGGASSQLVSALTDAGIPVLNTQVTQNGDAP